MVEKKTIAAMMAGSGVGISQTFILREYVDKVYGKIPGLEGLGGFGTYSAMMGIISGAITTGLGLGSVLTGKGIKSEAIQLFLIGHGIPALGTGFLSGLFPVPPPVPPPAPAAPARAPASPGRVTLRSAGQVAPTPTPAQTSAIPLRT